MDAIYGDLFWCLDYDEDEMLDIFELHEGLEDADFHQSLEDEQVGFTGALI
jgi:hypothetical protein